MELVLYPYQINALQDLLAENGIDKIREDDIREYYDDTYAVSMPNEKAQAAFYALLFEAMSHCDCL